MKELSIQEKAIAYDKAIKEAAIAYKDEDKHLKATLERIFPELKESEDCEDKRISKEITQFLKQNNGWNKEWLSWLEKQGEKPQGKSAQEAVKEEKADNANKVEPKFKVGDWVVTSYGKVNQVIAVDLDGDEFTLDDYTYFSGSWKDNYHLWTIQDAKDGDVLVDEDNNIGIYRGKVDDVDWHSYIYLGCDNYLHGFNIGGYHNIDNTKPATKEQRDTLMKAMADAGYTFDFKKKELNRTETL